MTAEARAAELGIEVPHYAIRLRESLAEGNTMAVRNLSHQLGSAWIAAREGDLVGVALTDDERAAGDRLDAAVQALQDYMDTHTDNGTPKASYDATAVGALVEAVALTSTEKHAASKAHEGRVNAAVEVIKERIERGEPPFPLPTYEDVASELAERGIDRNDETRDMDYEDSTLVHTAAQIEEQHKITARIEELESPEAVAEREDADRKAAAAWKAFRAYDKTHDHDGFTKLYRWQEFVRCNPDLDLGIELPRSGSADETLFTTLRSNARDQKSGLPKSMVSEAFLGMGGAQSVFIRSDRIVEVMKQHQKASSPDTYTRGGSSGYQVTGVQPARYMHEGKVFYRVDVTPVDRSAPANGVYAWREQLARMDRLKDENA
ncbi:hypothetical protein [Mycobacteroides abscessus]|uniref:hypothetical protein n=1 Tax=Mycobacteroides abscessus TaxID=36809 RepID=UPI000941FCB7|nr:hypothetical protein [Mycobacteroides abscessus]